MTKTLSEELFKIKVDLINKSNNETPNYQSKEASGFDIRANLEQDIILKPFERAIIPTGLFFALPDNFEMQIRSRSGLAAKNGVCVLNSPGTIDNDYRGEIKIILINLGNEDFIVSNGDRIAQGVLSPFYGDKLITFNNVEVFENETIRSNNGLGSTGIK